MADEIQQLLAFSSQNVVFALMIDWNRLSVGSNLVKARPWQAVLIVHSDHRTSCSYRDY